MSHTPPLKPLPQPNSVPGNRRRNTITAVLLFIASAAFTLWQNTRVAVLWDLSYLLDSSYRISLGQLPYRDFPFAHAPLTFLLHAAIIHLFGRIYFPHILCAALEAGLATVLTWRMLITLVRERKVVILAQPESPYLSFDVSTTWLLATLLTAPLTVLGIYAIYPHPIYDSDCILSILFALYMLQRSDESPIRNAIAGAACILPLFIKQNIGLPFLLITILSISAIAVLRHLRREAITPQLAFLGGVSLAFTAALLLLHATVGLHNYLYWTITFAAQRRLPGLSLILETYRQTSLVWTIPAATAGLILLHRNPSGAPSRSQSRRDLGEIRLRLLAYFLLALPFLYTVVAFAFSNDADDRSDQLLSLWPHLLLLAAALVVYNLRKLGTRPTINALLPLILLATIHGAFLSQQLWGSTYAIWPLLILLIAIMLMQIPTLARPLAATVATTFLLCGGLYASSHERLSYIQMDGPESHATLPELRGLTAPGPSIPAFEELVRVTNSDIPANDGILLLPGEVPFYFATGRTPQFPILLFDPATDPYTPQQTLAEARAHNIRWLIVTRHLQLTTPPKPDLPDVLRALQQDFVPYRTLTNYDIYRRK